MENEIVQFYQIYHKLPYEISLKLGSYGKIVGSKTVSYTKKSFILEFSDNTRFWFFQEEIRIPNYTKFK